MSKILFLLAFLPAILFAQNDSTLLLAPERLTERDILPRDLSKKKTVAISATRSLDAVEEVPFTTVVFTAEDILRNGFVTLTDVLKAAPGIRVSQPGNAVEGETFIVRGLSGNQYMKVLINDVPIKPSLALGMPIGAQLPIRQAERIEILYGPAGAIYGDETCAGVMNIILKESERPVYTQADLGFGRFGYNSLDLMFGGKFGKDKKIFRFSLYGSSTVRDRTDIFYDQDLYNTNKYLPLGLDSSLYRRIPNFRAASADPSDSFPRFSQIPHESRMFGINLTWRWLHFTYHRMQRFDHTSLGISPLAVAYANPSNQLSERIETFTLGFKGQRKRRSTYTNLSFQRYTVDNTSSTTYIFDQLSAANYRTRGGPALSDTARAALLRNIYNWYASEERFATANGLDARIESRMSVLIGKRKRMQFDAGAQANLGAGVPLVTYLNAPVEIAIDGNVMPNIIQPIHTNQQAQVGFHGFGFSQLSWRGKHLHVVGGGSASIRLGEGGVLAPRLGALYRLDSNWTFRANVATGIRHASLYGSAHTYQIVPQSGFVLQPGNPDPQPEKTYASEAAIRYTTRRGSSLEGLLFWQEAHNLYRPGYLVDEPGIVYSQSYGFRNAPGLALSMWGFQGNFRSGSLVIPLTIDKKKEVPLTNRMEFFVQYARGREWFGYDFPSTNEVRNQPKWHTQFRYYFKAGKKFELVISSNQQGSTLRKSVIFQDIYRLPERSRLDKFTTWDFMSRLYLSNHFLVYFHVINVFDRHYAGIDATGTPDDLIYNPQQGRQWRLGVNYNMN
ncbi:MAG: TonB-dependent receptor [Saprospiraceae bacterium]|nr:TonB-dependent receptor [Saprospiraceae bacterium]